MTSTMAINSTKSGLNSESIEKLLAEAAKEINLPDVNATRPPRLMLNYQRNIAGIPEGSWVYGQKVDETGKLTVPGILVDKPEIIIMAVRYQYAYYSSEAKKYFRSPMFKRFGNFIKKYKVDLVEEVKEQTRKNITGDDLRADQLVYALVKIGDEWKPCYVPNFHGSNYIVLQNYLKTFQDIPYCAYSTYLPNGVAVRSGATLYYKIESISRGEEMFEAEFLQKLIGDALNLNNALDNNFPVAGEDESSEQNSSRQAKKLPSENGDDINEEEIPF